MIRYYRLENNHLVPATDFKNKKVLWVDMVDPTDDELIYISDTYEINLDDLEDCLDENERPRYNYDIIRKNNFLLIRGLKNYEIDTIVGPTFPFGLFLTKEGILITIYLKIYPTIENIYDKIYRKPIENGWFLILEILHQIFQEMDQLSQKIAKTIKELQPKMMESHNVRDIRRPFELNNYLIFFNTATLGNSNALKSFFIRHKVVFETNLELFEKYDEVQTDIDQTNQFSDIYRGVLANSLDAFASVINNNFTSVMKIVGSLTLIVAIPTMFASFYGMNVVIPGDVNTGNPYTFFIIILISTILSFFAYRIFKKRNWI